MLTEADVGLDLRLRRAMESGTLPKLLVVCGPAGTGKTYAIVQTLHLIAADLPNVRILICRRTRASLTESVCVTLEQEILPSDGMGSVASGASRHNRQSYRYPSGSEIVLGGLDKPDRILSTAWDIVYVNEAIELDATAWDTLSSRLGRPGRSTDFGYLIGDTNPGDPSHWIRSRSVAGELELWDTTHRANPALYDERRGEWTALGREYMARLDLLSGTRRKRLLEGLWAAGEGQWFETFGDGHVSPLAEFDPAFPVHLAIDCGVHTAAVWFQVRRGDEPRVSVFGDYYAFGLPASSAAEAIRVRTAELCGGRYDRGTIDPAGRSATSIGPTVLGEYERAGLRGLVGWPSYPGSVADGLALLESFVAVDPPGLAVHPRCRNLIEAFSNYRRAKRGGQWIDRPEDPQHPHEDLMDALRGGLMDVFPEGRKPQPLMRRMPARKVF